ncbi:hypothetical protein vBAcePPAc_0053 [Aeromonas phage vB_AceP_PAc]|nr:hypothetical protein vBAcePPAc_0053 [Aeromonas phage vB_AceP_PAc]
MNRVESLTQFYSDVVLGEVLATDPAYNCDDVTVTWATGMAPGALVKADGTWAATADAALVVGVVTDVRAQNLTGELVNGSQYVMAVGKRGLILNKTLLKFSDGAINAAAQAVLEGTGNKVTNRVIGQ